MFENDVPYNYKTERKPIMLYTYSKTEYERLKNHIMSQRQRIDSYFILSLDINKTKVDLIVEFWDWKFGIDYIEGYYIVTCGDHYEYGKHISKTRLINSVESFEQIFGDKYAKCKRT